VQTRRNNLLQKNKILILCAKTQFSAVMAWEVGPLSTWETLTFEATSWGFAILLQEEAN
jgi:hypothetical protein